MNPFRTLRGRLIVSMLLILALAVGVSTLLDRLQAPPASLLAPLLDAEPYQDALVLAGYGLPALALIWLVSSWSLRPLARASQDARRIGPRDPAARLSNAGLPAEIAPLVDAINGALDRMADAMTAERRFTENAAHELRTPLAVLGMRLQRARHAGQGAGALDWVAIERDLAHMNRLVAQLLDLARKDNAGRSRRDHAPVNLSRVAREAAAMMLPVVEAQHRALAIDLPEILTTDGSASDLRDALRNLLENAVQHGAGTVSLAAAIDAATGDIVVHVSDEGAGMAAGQEAVMLGRFHKGATSEGSGLGLAIVSEVVRAHGGTVAVMPGAGCRVQVRLPGSKKKEAVLF